MWFVEFTVLSYLLLYDIYELTTLLFTKISYVGIYFFFNTSATSSLV